MSTLERDEGQRRDGDSRPPSGRRKGVLFCPNCDHSGPAPCDWEAVDDPESGRFALRCPSCGTIVTERPPSGDAGSD